MKLILRVILSIIFFVPISFILWLTTSFFCLVFVMGFIDVGGVIIGWLINNKEMVKENAEDLDLPLFCIISPYIFFRDFIKGENPFQEFCS